MISINWRRFVVFWVAVVIAGAFGFWLGYLTWGGL